MSVGRPAGTCLALTRPPHKLVFPTVEGSESSRAIIAVTSLDANLRGQQHTTRDSRVENKGGLECRWCGRKHFRVIYTRPA